MMWGGACCSGGTPGLGLALPHPDTGSSGSQMVSPPCPPPPHTVMDGAPDTRYTGHALEGPATHRQEPRSVTGSHAAHWGRGKAAAMWRMVVIRPLPKPPWSLLKTMTNWSTEAPAARLLYTPQRRATETAPGRKRAPEDRSPSTLVNQAARRRSLCGLCASRVPAP